MPRQLVRVVVVLALISGFSLAHAFSTGPPATRTGAPAVGGVAAELVCTACHNSFALNLPGATLQLLDVPDFYWPDSLYTIRVRLTSTFGTAAQRRWGFEITAVTASDGQGAGTFDVTGDPNIQLVTGAGVYASRKYVEHTSAGTFPGTAGPTEWAIRWRTPPTDVGRIFFFAAGNAANNGGTPAGDHIYTVRDTSDISPLVDAPVASRVAVNTLAPARPNPFRGETTLDYALSKEGPVDLVVFDLNGRHVRTLFSGTRAAGPGAARWDGTDDGGRPAAAGVYFVRLVTSRGEGPITRKVMLAR